MNHLGARLRSGLKYGKAELLLEKDNKSNGTRRKHDSFIPENLRMEKKG